MSETVMRYFVLLLTSLLLACASSTDPACDICTTSAIVYGSVTDAAGRPVSGMPLDIRVFADDCAGEVPRGGSDSNVPRTDVTGHYRAVVLSLLSPFTANCFVIRPNPGSLPQWPTDRVERSGELRMRADAGSEPRDSIRFDLQLPAS